VRRTSSSNITGSTCNPRPLVSIWCLLIVSRTAAVESGVPRNGTSLASVVYRGTPVRSMAVVSRAIYRATRSLKRVVNWLTHAVSRHRRLVARPGGLVLHCTVLFLYRPKLTRCRLDQGTQQLRNDEGRAYLGMGGSRCVLQPRSTRNAVYRTMTMAAFWPVCSWKQQSESASQRQGAWHVTAVTGRLELSDKDRYMHTIRCIRMSRRNRIVGL